MPIKDNLEPPLKPVILQVSLSSLDYTKEFAHRFFSWAQYSTHNQVIVLLLDDLAKINFNIFKPIDYEEANNRAKKRARDLYNMFNRSKGKFKTSTTVICQSSMEYKWNKSFKNISNMIRRTYGKNETFKRSVQNQIRENLSIRVKKHGYRFFQKNMPKLKNYILEETALFEYLYGINNKITEAYTGPLMNIRRRIWYAGFDGLNALMREPKPSYYADVSCFVDGRHLVPYKENGQQYHLMSYDAST